MSFWDGGAFITWRWSSMVSVVRALLMRRGALLVGWDMNKFGRADAPLPEQDDNTQGPGQRQDGQSGRKIQSPVS